MENKIILEKLNEIGETLRELKGQSTPPPMPFKAACSFLGVKAGTLYRWNSEGVLPFFRPNGKAIFYLRSDLEKFLMQHRVPSRDELREGGI